MGYRSEIYIIIDSTLKDEFNTVLASVNLAEHIKRLPEEEQDVDGSLKYYGDWLKWNTGYEDVTAVNGFIDDHYETCALIGIGEDGAESANVGSPNEFDMYTVSTIEW